MLKNGQNGSHLGYHLLVDFFGCTEPVLEYTEQVKDIMLKAIKASDLTPVSEGFYNFTPVGVSGFIILSESHASIHTWPEYQLASIDFYTCGKRSLKNSIELLQKELGATHFEIKEIDRAPKNIINASHAEKHVR